MHLFTSWSQMAKARGITQDLVRQIVSDTGPLLHLHEAALLMLLEQAGAIAPAYRASPGDGHSAHYHPERGRRTTLSLLSMIGSED